MEKPASTWSFDQGTLTVRTSEKEPLGFAVRKLRYGHAVQEIRERADSKLYDRADTAAIEAKSVNRRVHQPLTWAYQWPDG